jgi:hypothetical protein
VTNLIHLESTPLNISRTFIVAGVVIRAMYSRVIYLSG